MIFETERLLIRNWIPESDAVYAFAIYSDPSIRVMQRLNMISMGRTNKYDGMETELYKLDAPF